MKPLIAFFLSLVGVFIICFIVAVIRQIKINKNNENRFKIAEEEFNIRN